jgi:hypothetical protein
MGRFLTKSTSRGLYPEHISMSQDTSPHHMASVAVGWALAQTATDVLKVGKGVVETATSDNVQVIALLACEGFGTTLAMSVESTTKAYK